MASKQRTFEDHPDSGHHASPVAPPGIYVLEGRIVIEPMGNGVRVTARAKDDRLLWGFVASQLAFDSPHALVAIYEALRKDVVEQLPTFTDGRDHGQSNTTQCLELIQAINAMLGKIRDRLSPKTVSDKTERRAAECLPALRDIVSMLTYEITDKPATSSDVIA